MGVRECRTRVRMKVVRKKRMMPAPIFQVMDENSRGVVLLSALLVLCCVGVRAGGGWQGTSSVARVSRSEHADGGGGSGFHKP